ncbi:DUF4270 domain-containing protein [Prolixibacter bellariivorans]|nr:DUF4270 domain-containing protein [Prolixibacter bellariivorans]
MIHKYFFKPGGVVIALALTLLMLGGCKKNDESLGLDLLPGSNLLNARYSNETGTISSYTFTDNKIRVDKPGFNIFGSFNDPLFGRTTASFAAQFRLPYYPSYSQNAVLDSAVLSLVYRKVYGDTITPQQVKVYKLVEPLNFDAQYLSSFDPKTLTNDTVVGMADFTPKFRTDSTGQDTIVQEIAVRLNDEVGNQLLHADSLDMVNNEAFLNFFKGLYVESQPLQSGGGLVFLKAHASLLHLYYHVADTDSLSFYYQLTTNSADVPYFEHDYTNAWFADHLNQEDVEDSLIFVQPTGGTKVKIDVPSLDSWADSTNCMINKATLTFHADTTMSDFRQYPMPNQLFLKIIKEDGSEAFPIDSQLSLSYYGGVYNSTDATYTFNITQHLQAILDGTVQNLGFYLVSATRKESADRVVLKGSKSSQPIQLEVNYTRYK